MCASVLPPQCPQVSLSHLYPVSPPSPPLPVLFPTLPSVPRSGNQHRSHSLNLRAGTCKGARCTRISWFRKILMKLTWGCYPLGKVCSAEPAGWSVHTCPCERVSPWRGCISLRLGVSGLQWPNSPHARVSLFERTTPQARQIGFCLFGSQTAAIKDNSNLINSHKHCNACKTQLYF